jgi:hypothetical protein
MTVIMGMPGMIIAMRVSVVMIVMVVRMGHGASNIPG